jgi:hypothetical protein
MSLAEMPNWLRETAYALGEYPRTHYVLIAITILLYWLAETRTASFRDKVAAGCAGVLFCVSIFDGEYNWHGSTPLPILGEIFLATWLYFILPITNGVVLFVLWKNLFGKDPVRAWVYTLLCIIHAPLSALVRYSVQ